MEKIKIKPCFKAYPDNPGMSGREFNFCPKCSTKLIAMEQDGVLRKVCAKCQYIQYINPLPGVAVIIENDHKLLIGKRSHKSFLGGKWCLPCGFIEHNESFVEAAYREVLEETGLRINVTSLINVSSNQLTPILHTIVTVLLTWQLNRLTSISLSSRKAPHSRYLRKFGRMLFMYLIAGLIMAEIVGGELQAGDDMVKIMWADNSVALPELAFESGRFIISKYFEKALIRIPIEAK